MYSFGIDLGGTNIAIGVVDTETGEIVKKGSVPTKASRHADEIMKDMASLCKKLAEEMGLQISDFAYAGIAAPGTIDNETGTVIYSNNIKMDNYPIAAKLMEYSGIKKVYCENDANAAAYGEAAYGASKGSKHSVMITLGTGLGGGVIVDGKLVTGINAAGSELGHTVISVGGLACTCGRRGCWEAYSSATGLINMTKRKLEVTPKDATIMHKMVEEDGKVSGRTAFNAMKKGDKVGKEVVDEYLLYLAEGITNMVNIFQPEVVVIGGGVCNEKEHLVEPLKSMVDAGNYYKGEKLRTEIKVAQLGNDAGIIGAAMLGF
ncbi:MAG: ROK family protein [Oscillospiraceae bacterium]|nr:ROK family protein [Oscillospiraceae bacterium]